MPSKARKKLRTYSDYTVAWICASSTGWSAAMAMLDEVHITLPTSSNDPNMYTLGSIGSHNIVVAYQLAGSAAPNVTQMADVFSSIKFGLLVGIGSGVPPNVRLGDVVVSTTLGQYPREITIDSGNAKAKSSVRVETWPSATSQLLLAAVGEMEAKYELAGFMISEYLERFERHIPGARSGYLKTASRRDLLFMADYSHVTRDPVRLDIIPGDDNEESCRFCDKTAAVERKRIESRVHYGLIASANQEIKSASLRDKLNQSFGEKVLCIETEISKTKSLFPNHLPCIVIRGICDYADTHKNTDWQLHAILMVAGYARELLQHVSPEDVDREPSLKNLSRTGRLYDSRGGPPPSVRGSDKIYRAYVPPPLAPAPPGSRSSGQLDLAVAPSDRRTVGRPRPVSSITNPILPSEQDIQILEWLTPVDYGPRHRDILRRWQPETGLWLLDSAEYKTWLETKKKTLFCPGDIGTGKTVITSAVINDVKSRFQTNLSAGIAYIYCDSRLQEAQLVDELIMSILKQLTQKLPFLPECIRQMYAKHSYAQTRPSLNDILGTLHTIIGEYSRVFIVVDALDECSTTSDGRKTFLDELSTLQTKFGANVFATSRLDPDIIAHFETNSVSLKMQTGSKDVEIYVKRYLEQLQAFSELDQRQQETVLMKILRDVDKSFLSAAIFVHLLEERLLREPSITDVVEDMLKSSQTLAEGDKAEDDSEAAAISKEERGKNQLFDDRNNFSLDFKELEQRLPQLQIKEAKQAAEQGVRESKRLTHKAEKQAAEGSVQSLHGLAHDLEQKDVVEGINAFRSEEIWATASTSREQFSDSGYASMPHGFTGKSEFSQNETIVEESYNVSAESDSNNNIIEDMDQADDKTEYSAATSLGDSRIEGLVSQLADQLIGEVHLDELDERSTKTVFSILQDLLKNFALKIGFNAQSQMQRDIMYYTHKYSGNIAQLLESRLSDKDRDRDQLDNRIAPEVAQEMTRDWLANLDEMDDLEPYNIPDDQDMDQELPQEAHPDQDYEEDGPTSAFDLSAHRDLISASPAYRWLLVTLRRELLLEVECSNSMKDIKQTILSSLKADRKISRSRPAEAFRTTFLINWDPIAFLKEQLYEKSLEEAIDKIITLAGSAKNAQALTTLQYLHQTWPTTGEYVLKLVKNVLRGANGQKYTCHLPEGAELTAWTTDTEFMIEVSGTAASIAEVGEQLAWLSASLRSSEYDAGIAFITPSLRIVQPEDTKARMHHRNIQYRFGYAVEKDDQSTLDNGECWHNLFRNPVLVKGFPVLRRPKLDTGLEIPLNMMSALANTQRVDEFDGKIFIKGFSTMLIPTDYTDGIITWHMQYNKDGKRISYYDGCVPHKSLSISDLEQSRHIVGWCSQANLIAGATGANYNVQRSGLPGPSANLVLRNISISTGQGIAGGVDFAMSPKDKPLRIQREGHMQKLLWMHENFVVLWDEKCKRGWLVNGTTALLHLARAALKRYQDGPLKDKFVFKSSSLEELTKETPKPAIEVLSNESILNLDIWSGTSQLEKGHRFLDLIDNLYNILDKMMDFQVNAQKRDGVPLSLELRERLDGWEFDDIANIRDCRPKVATSNTGFGWVKLTTEVGAVVLFGKEFGEIIQPSSTEGLCTRWSQMPENEYFLGACVSDLLTIIRLHGEEGEQLRLTSNISWHRPLESFGPCRCTSTASHSNLIHELRKFKSSREPSNNREAPNPHGAVIFGHKHQSTPKWGDIRSFMRPSKMPTPQVPPKSSLRYGKMSFATGSSASTSDLSPGLSESNEISTDPSLTTLLSRSQELAVSELQISSYDPKVILDNEDVESSKNKNVETLASQKSDGTELRKGKSRLERWKHFKQRFSKSSREQDKN